MVSIDIWVMNLFFQKNKKKNFGLCFFKFNDLSNVDDYEMVGIAVLHIYED